MLLEEGRNAVGRLFGYDSQWHKDESESSCEYLLPSRTCGEPDVIDGHTVSVSILKRVGERLPGEQNISRTRNAYFSHDYDRKLKDGERKEIEKLVLRESMNAMPAWVKEHLL